MNFTRGTDCMQRNTWEAAGAASRRGKQRSFESAGVASSTACAVSVLQLLFDTSVAKYIWRATQAGSRANLLEPSCRGYFVPGPRQSLDVVKPQNSRR